MQSLNIEINTPKELTSSSNKNGVKESRLSIKEEENEKFFIFKRIPKKIFKFPFIIYIVLFTFVLFIASLISLIIYINIYKQNYIFIKDIYTKPHISDHNYSKLIFENNLEIVLTQVHYNDTAGGALSFENGYLDLIYEPGLLKLALLSLRKNDRDSIRELNDYIGDLLQSFEEFYSTLYFTILNSGFEKILTNFKQYTSHDNDTTNFTRIIEFNLRRRFDSTMPSFNSVNEREKYLIEYLVYDIKDKNGKDINRHGTSNEVREILNGNYTILEYIMNQLFNTKKMKLIFFSHYKMSLMKKIILRNLHDLIYHKNPKEISYTQYDTLITNKIIYHQIKENDCNYIKINYYVNNPEVNLSQLYLDSGYFNYLKYILDETNEDSLYYKLTINDEEIDIKSLSSNFEVVLKSRIRFTILIELNHYSYKNIKKIIEIVYEHMEKIKSHINNLKPNDDRVNELYYINQQNFSFTEDIHSGEFYKNKAKDLFYRDEADYFLREVWLPPDFNKNKTNISFYTNQLTQENSVVIIGINNKTKSKYNLEETDIALIFNDIKETNSWNISYSIHDLDNLNINNNKVKDSFELKYYPNKFISNYTSDYKIPEMEKQQHNGIYNPFNETDDLIKFYWLKDTSFKLPKVFVIFYFFHPFQRPNSTDDDDKDKMFYHLMLYLSYMKREAEFALADAIRAGNTFKLGYAENYIYIDIMSFSDVIENVLNIINERIIAVNNETIQKIQKDYEIYKDYAFEEYINFDNINVKEVLKHEYFKYISKINDEFPPIYNYYKLKKEKSENFEEINKDYISFLKMPILYTFIMGYCEENDIKKYYNIFSQGSNNPHFTMTLLLANLSTSLSGNEFVENSLTRNDLKENINIKNCTDLKDSKSSYSFMRFTKFSDYDRIPVEIFRRLIQENRTDFSVEIINQKSIYLRFFFPDNYTTENIKQRAMDIIKYIGDIISQPFDIFGGRYYYLVKNLENEYTKTPNDLKSAAVDFSFNQLYQRKRDDNSHKLNPEDYKNFTDTIEQFFNNNPNYIEFSYKENNI